MKTKFLLFALLAQLFALPASAYDLYKDGIYYNLNSDDMTAEVTYKHDPSKYDGNRVWDGQKLYYDINIYYGSPLLASGETNDYIIPEMVNGYKVTSIGDSAFYMCLFVTSVTIPSSVKRINPYAFYGCSRIKTLTIPSSVEYIGQHAVPVHSNYSFQDDGLTYINNVLWEDQGTMPENANIVLKEGTTCICAYAFYGQFNMASIVIPESVKYIGAEAFYNCTNLKSITLPKKLTVLSEAGTFAGCVSLESIEVPAYDEDDGAFANIFNGCDNLKSVSYAEGTTRISSYVGVSSPKLSYLYLPSTLTTIEASWPSSNLTTVKVAMKQPVPITGNVFPNRANATLYVPLGSKAAYAGASFWRGFKEIIEVDDDTDVSALDNVIYLEKMEGNAGTTATMSFRMKNSAAIRGFQFDLYLPDGVTAVKNAKGRIQGALSSERLPEDDEHTLTISEQPDGAIRFLCGSQYDETFIGNDGEIATLQVSLAGDMEDGDYTVAMKDMRLSETDITKFYDIERVKSTYTIWSYTPGDIDGDGAVNVTDYIGVANHILGIPQAVFIEKAGDVDGDGNINVTDYIGVANIILTGSPFGNSNSVKPAYSRARSTDLSTEENVIYVEPVAADAGTQATLSFQMKNTAPIRGFQFDLYLPDGVTVVKNAKGRIQGSLSEGRLPEDDEHTLTIQEQADGGIRFLCGSQYDETFTGNIGEIATLQVSIAEGMPNGNYPIVLKNMRLTETDISKFYDSDDVETTLRVNGGAEPEKCVKPTISYAGGKLTFNCETEGAECHSTITDTDIASYSSNEVQLGVTYNISVYATRDGYADSDVATATLCWIDAEPRTEGLDGDAVTEVKALPVLIQTQGGTISVRGIDDGMEVSAYGIDGKKEGSAISKAGQAVINTNLTSGSTAVVKIGEKSVKVLIE